MKNNLKWFIIGAAASLSVTCLATAFSDSLEKTITAVFSNIKIVVDGAQITPKDASGKEVEPFTYQDTTYLPVRAVSEALGKDVSWDEETKTVYIGENIPAEEVTVTNAEELVGAIGSNKKIILAKGEYDLTNLSKASDSENYFWEEVLDGHRLVINEVKNLTIEGPSDGTAEIKTSPRYAEVLYFINSSNVTLKNIKAGHNPQPYECDAGVVDFEHCNNIKVDSCYLYGCGSVGITARECTTLNIKNSTITDCSLRGIYLYKTNDITVKGTKFTDNRAYTDVFDISSCRNVLFEECVVSGNKALQRCVAEISSSNVTFSKCTFENNSVSENYKEQSVNMFVSDSGSTVVKDCIIRNNNFADISLSEFMTFVNCTIEKNSFKK